MSRKNLLVLGVVLSFLVGWGCERKQEKGAPTTPPAGGAGAKAPEAETAKTAGGQILDPAKVSGGGAIAGTIKVEGSVPASTPVDMSQKPECVALHKDKPATNDNLVVGPEKGLKYAFVYVKKGLESYKFEVPKEPVTIDQVGCVYVPHVFGIMVNQDLKVKNSDGFLHNVDVKDIGMNKAQPNVGEEVVAKCFKREGIGVTFQCQVHSWMRAYACASKHPYFAVTKEDGKYEIKNLPAGKYTIAVWHEPVRVLKDPPALEVDVEVKAGETQTADFAYSIK